MNESETQRLLDDLLEKVPDHPVPLADLSAAGERAQRSRRRRTAGGAALLIVAVALAGALVPQALGDDDSPSATTPTATSRDTEAPEFGPTWVGLGRIVVDVPWATTGCRGGRSDGVIVAGEGECGQAYTLPQGAVTLTPLSSDPDQRAARGVDDPSTINGVDVLLGAVDDCATPSPLAGCSTTIVATSENVVLTISARTEAEVDTIRASLRLLPDDYTTVPPLGDLARDLPPITDVVASLTASGLAVEPTPWTNLTYVRAIDTEQGSVVPRGSIVTLTTTPYRKGPPPPASGADADADAVQLDGTWRVTLPGRSTATAQPGENPGDATGSEEDRPPVDGGTLTFASGQLTGDDGCNDLFGTYVQDGADLTFDRNDLGSTLVGCGDEPPVVQTLLAVRHVTQYDGHVYLHADNYKIILDLRRIG